MPWSAIKIMNLPFISQKEPEKEYFLALLLKPYAVGAILFEKSQSHISIVSHKEEEIGKEIDILNSEELIQASDKVISFIEDTLPKDSKLEKAIFAVPYEWIDEGKIKSEYLTRLKKICDDLGLVPMGFIMSIEAIVHSIQEKEGAPITAIFVESAKKHVFIYIVKGGAIVEVKHAAVEDDLVKKVEHLLLKVENVDVLPSKIILLAYEGVDSIQQEFISHTWDQDIPFLHLPQVVALEKGFENEAIINGVATQMGTEVGEEVSVREPARDEEEVEAIQEEDSSFFGFVKGEDVAEKVEKESREEESNLVEVHDFRKADEEESAIVETETVRGKNPLASLSGLLSAINIAGLLNNFKRFRLPSFGGSVSNKPKLIALGVGLIIIIFVFSYAYYNYLLKAEITVFTDQKSFEKTIPVTFASDNSFKDGKIKVNEVFVESEGNSSKDVSGKKETGDSAKGEVTIYNKLDSPKTFSKGSSITSSNSLNFTLTDDVTVASTSSFSTSLSSSKVKVQASKYGKEYNLPSGTNFTVGEFPSSSYIAKNDNAFSGGTTKDIQVVSQKDIDDLMSQVTGDLEKKGAQDAKTKLSSDENVLPQALSSEITEKNFDKKVGDEASSISLSAKIKFQFASYKTSDLEELIKEAAKGEISQDFSLKASDSKIDIKDLKVNKDTVSANLAIKAVFEPTIDQNKLLKSVAGKSLSESEKQIRNFAGVTDVNIKLKNKLPLFPVLLPKNLKNIAIITQH